MSSNVALKIIACFFIVVGRYQTQSLAEDMDHVAAVKTVVRIEIEHTRLVEALRILECDSLHLEDAKAWNTFVKGIAVSKDFLVVHEAYAHPAWDSIRIFKCQNILVQPQPEYLVAITSTGGIYPISGFSTSAFSRLTNDKVRRVESVNQAEQLADLFLRSKNLIDSSDLISDSIIVESPTLSAALLPHVVRLDDGGFLVRIGTNLRIQKPEHIPKFTVHLIKISPEAVIEYSKNSNE